MRQTIIDRVRTDFERLPLSDQAEIRAAAQNYAGAFERLSVTDKQKVLQRAQALVRRKARAVYGLREEQLSDFDYEVLEYEVPVVSEEPIEELPELAKPTPNPKFTDAQKAMMYGQLNTVKERKPSAASRQWKAGTGPRR